MDNLQACIQARLIERLQDSELTRLRNCVLLTTYLYTYSPFTQIWKGSLIPLHISSRLLLQVQELALETVWGTPKSAMLWCIVMAGSLTPKGPTRDRYGLLLRIHFGRFLSEPNIHASWFAIAGTLDQFLWS
ncbi:hypothetical protein DM02DRAFT_650405 [Periconia macrospinosa]|uniref:Transcription factor domain-containing protein n=1 Tax=Periconia macrospinosa TaxID=97972 RepID=A0A2V1E5H6_9PLEO|nr:hypothetical protein DM02DRAFT_650405 [Periconia macrospinosa]